MRRRPRAAYPFAFQFDVVVALHPESRLEVRFETTNRGADPLPYYAGHHFYLAVPHRERADWTLHLPCAEWAVRSRAALSVTRRQLPTSFASMIRRWSIASRSGCGKRGRAPDPADRPEPGFRELGSSIPWYAITTWTETPESDFYCVEPWLGCPMQFITVKGSVISLRAGLKPPLAFSRRTLGERCNTS